MSASTVHGTVWYCPTGHAAVHAVHTRAVVSVQGAVWYVEPVTHAVQPAQTVSVVAVQLADAGCATGHTVHAAHCRGAVADFGTVMYCPSKHVASFAHTTSDDSVAGVEMK